MAVPFSLMNTLSLPDLVSLTMQRFVEGPMLVEDYADAMSLFIREDVPPNTGSTRVYNEIDGQTYASYKSEGLNAAKALVVMGYSMTMTKRRFAKEIDITYEMRKENRHPEMIAAMTDLSQFCYQRLAIDLTHRLTFATSTSYVDMDGQTVATTVGDALALVSAVHTLSGSAITFSNVITGNPVFSKGGFQVARYQANTQIYSHMGEQRVMKFDTVVTSNDPATVDAVKILVQSQTDPTQDNPGVINSYAGQFRHVILWRLATSATGAMDATKDKAWGFVATKGSPKDRWQAYVGIWEEPNLKVPAPGNNGEDVHNDNWVFGVRGGWGIVTVSPRGFLWSNGLGQ
jgi:hypothetical protein